MQRPSFTEPQFREAIAASSSYAGAMRLLGLRPAGGNFGTLRKYAQLWDVDTSHFGTGRGPYPRGGVTAAPLEEVLVRGSTYARSSLKKRLYDEGLKVPQCELCGQGQVWRGQPMSLILDHINGDADDNRLKNLRIVCPNCNATLATHCGRNKSRGRPPRRCGQCGGMFRARHAEQIFCSQACSTAHNAPLARRVERPPLDQLLEELTQLGYVELGRRYGVTDNAIRKWFRAYGMTPPPGPGHELHPPPPPPRVLSDRQALRALALLADGKSMYAVAKLLGVDRNTIRDLRRGNTYKHLERPAALRDAA